jgi:hypothetical protein
MPKVSVLFPSGAIVYVRREIICVLPPLKQILVGSCVVVVVIIMVYSCSTIEHPVLVSSV